MDTNNWSPTAVHGAEPSMEAGDWRTHLPPDARKRIVYKIMETLKRHLPFSGQEGLEELKKIAVRFEEKIYTAAVSQSDYLRKLSLKMLTMESKSQNTVPNSLPHNPSCNNDRPLDSGAYQNMQPLHMPMSDNQSQALQPILSEHKPSNIGFTGVQSSGSLTSVLPPVGGQNNTVQNIYGFPQSSAGILMGQGIPSNMLTSSVMEPSMIQSVNLSGLQQMQPSMAQHLPVLQQQQQALMMQQRLLSTKQQLMAQQSNMQQNQLTGQQMQTKQNASNMVPTQDQLLQQQLSQQQLMAQMQFLSTQLQQQHLNQLQRDVEPGLEAPGSLLQQHNGIDQQKQLYRSQTPLSDISSTSLDSTPQNGHSIGGDWQEEVHQKVPRKNILPGLKEKLGSNEKQMVIFVNSNEDRKSVTPLQHGQHGQPHIQNNNYKWGVCSILVCLVYLLFLHHCKT